jgi:DNA primase
VRVILLPEGEDPDSFAKRHNASDLKAFLESNQHDFIRFKTQLLMEDAQNDPTKRSEMILQIVRSIAVIPEVIKRQVYIKDTAILLSLPEDVLTRKVAELRKQAADERQKRKITSGQGNTPSPEPTPDPQPTNPTPEPIAQPLSHKERNILNLIQVLIRYGERVLYQTEDQMITVGEYIITEINNDSIDIPNPLHKLVIDEYVANYQAPQFVASVFFQHHPNAAISQLAVDMIADKYQISRMYNKRSISENVVQEVQQDETSVLPELVQRLLLELKYTVVDERIDSMQRLLKEAQERDDWQLITAILEQQPQLMDIRTQLCRALGNRVIVR